MCVTCENLILTKLKHNNLRLLSQILMSRYRTALMITLLSRAYGICYQMVKWRGGVGGTTAEQREENPGDRHLAV